MELRVERMVWNYNKVEEQLCEKLMWDNRPPLPYFRIGALVYSSALTHII